MATIAEALAIAVQHHQSGNLQAAEQIYRQILQAAPDHAEALHLLGVIAGQVGRHDLAVEYISRSIQIDGRQAVSHNGLGTAYSALRRISEAAACYERAIQLNPAFAEAHHNLAVVRKQQGRLDDTIACCRRALQFKPDYTEAHNVLGVALMEQGKRDEAIARFERALRFNPDYAETCNNLGVALLEQGNAEQALAWCQRALLLKPDYPDAYNSLGNAWKEKGRFEDANACYRRALELKPDFAFAHHNLGLVRKEEGRLDEALVCFRKALELMPDHAEAHFNQAAIWLARGEFERGWPEYEWRWKIKQCTRRPQFSQRVWDGASLGGQTILLYDEQGLGDTIQFIRYAELVKERGARVVVECHDSLVPLLAHCPGIAQLVPRGGTLPPFHVHCPLLSLPGVLKTTLESIPRRVPYMFVDQGIVERWRPRLSQHQGLRVGIVWQGRRTFQMDRFRSIPLVEFAPVAEVPGVCLISLQKGFGEEQLVALSGLFRVSEAGEFDEYSGTDRAAILLNLDLLITSDTAMAHLAGALGVPVWVALPFVPDWRWLLDRDDSPWYPTMRLFRQIKRGDWGGVFQRIKDSLAGLVG